MLIIDPTKIVEIFCQAHDLHLAHQQWKQKTALPPASSPSRAGRKSKLCASEVITILILYQLSGMKNFQYFYQRMSPVLADYFPNLVSYNRFVELIGPQAPLMWMFCMWKSNQSQRTGSYYADSKKLCVCKTQRIESHKVFKGIAARGKSSTGWFFGLKLHLVINHQGEAVNFLLTSANKADNNKEVLSALLQGLQGNVYADKGYLTKLFEDFYQKGIKIVTKVRNNMKKLLLNTNEAMMLRKRGLIESVFDILMTVFDIEHSRHRKPDNAFAHILAALCAYAFMERKPALVNDFARIH